MKTYGIFIFLMFGLVHLGYTQKKQAWVDAADHAFAVEKDYYKAYRYYDAALQFRKDTSDVLHLLFQKAESARLINAYADAQDTYLELTARAPNDFMAKRPYRCAWAYLGDLQLSRAYSGTEAFDVTPYEQALHYFSTYESLAPATPGGCDELVSRGKAVIRFVTGNRGERLTNESIRVESAGPNVNSEFPDFAPMSWGNRLFFTSFRHAVSGKEIDAIRYFSRIYLSERGEPARPMDAMNPSPKDTFHVGQTTINRAQDRIYFTRCTYVDQTLQTRCDLYYYPLNDQGNPVGRAVEVVELNLKNSTLTHPSLGWDPVREREVLFFASDRPGSRGKMDIWKSELEEGHFGPPTNELLINTPGDEITPFYQNGILYFSSDGRPDRYGGYDIFYTPDPQRTEPFNMGQKINSSADETYYSQNDEGNLAYFSSNRLTSNTLGVRDDLKEAGSQDIYYYLILKPSCTLEVSTFTDCSDTSTKEREGLADVELTLFDITDEGSSDDEMSIAPTFYRENSHRFDNVLRPNRKYLLVGKREGFQPQRIVLDFLDGKKPCANGVEHLELNFRCEQAVLQVQTHHQEREMREAIVHIIPLSEMVQEGESGMKDRTATGAQIPCASESSWQLTYSDDKIINAFTGEAPIELDQSYLIIAELEQPDGRLLGFKRYEASSDSEAFCGQSCRDLVQIDLEYLPNVQLFFEKGMPGPDPYDVSSLSYLMTLDRYQRQKAAYLKQFPAGDQSEYNLARRAELEQFFNEQLEQSFPAFYEFLQQATDLLCQNIPITLKAKACNTPDFVGLNPEQTTYMEHLTNRRLESIQQELVGFGLSTERWPGLFQLESVSGSCVETGHTSTSPRDAWVERENPGSTPFFLDAALGRRVELSLTIGLETDH